MHVRPIRGAKPYVGVNVSANDCLSECDHTMSWQLVQVPSPYDCWDGLQQTP